MKRLLLAFAITSALSGVVLAAEWQTFRGDERRTGTSSELLQPPLKVVWEFQAQGPVVSSPSVAGGRVYFGSRDKSVYALDAATGQKVWSYETGGWVDASPAVTSETLVVTSRDGHAYCLDAATGQKKWTFDTGGTDCSSPLVHDGRVYFGSGFPQKMFYALDAETGAKIWEAQLGQMVYSSPAVSGRYLYVGANNGQLYCFHKDTGVLRWTHKTKGDIYFASPALGTEAAFIAGSNFDWSVYAVRLTSGAPVWEFKVPDRAPSPTYVSSVAVGQGRVYVVSGYAQQYLYCVDEASGALMWKAELDAGTRLGFASSPVLTEDTVYVVTAAGRLCAFEATTGRLVWSASYEGGALASPSVADGTLYGGFLDGKVRAWRSQ